MHGWPPRERAGTEQYAHWLAHWQSQFRKVAVHTRRLDPGRPNGVELQGQDGQVQLHEFVNNMGGLFPWIRASLSYPGAEDSVLRLVGEFRPNLIHVHHLIGHSMGLLPKLARLKIPLIVQMQDWWSSCARVNLFDRYERACDGPALAKCRRCFSYSILPGLSPLLHALRPAWVRHCFGSASAFVTASPSTVAKLRLDVPVHTLPYGVPSPPPRPPRTRSSGPLRCGYLGTIWPGKGVHTLLEAFRGVSSDVATLEVWGLCRCPDYQARLQSLLSPGVRWMGVLPESRKVKVTSGFDLLCMPSIAAESYGLVAREALALGVPVLASRQSALTALADEGALLVEPGDPLAWRNAIGMLAEQPQQLEQLRTRIRRPPSVAEHAERIEEIYALYHR